MHQQISGGCYGRGHRGAEHLKTVLRIQCNRRKRMHLLQSEVEWVGLSFMFLPAALLTSNCPSGFLFSWTWERRARCLLWDVANSISSFSEIPWPTESVWARLFYPLQRLSIFSFQLFWGTAGICWQLIGVAKLQIVNECSIWLWNVIQCICVMFVC